MMQNIKWVLALITACTIVFFSCSSDRGMVDARVINTADLTYEGCGYVLELQNQELLQPIYLPSDYQLHNLKVKVKYKHSGMQDTCAYGTVIYDLIDIEKIKKNLD